MTFLTSGENNKSMLQTSVVIKYFAFREDIYEGGGADGIEAG
jgi:hypothetical protein